MGQTIIVTNPPGIAPCKDSLAFQLAIRNNSASVIDTISVSLVFQNGNEFAGITPYDSLIVDDPRHVTFSLNTSAFPGDTIKFTYYLKTSCSTLSCSGSANFTDSIYITTNIGPSQFPNRYTIGSACISYNQNDAENLLAFGNLRDTITRKIVLKNTGNTHFNGEIQIIDSSANALVIDSIFLTHPVTSVTYYNSTDSSVTSRFTISSLAPGDSIVIIDRVIITNCFMANNGVSKLYIRWGCVNNPCQAILPPTIVLQVLKLDKNPDVVLSSQVLSQPTCLEGEEVFRVVAKNESDMPAKNVFFFLNTQSSYTYMRLDSIFISGLLPYQTFDTTQTILFDTVAIPRLCIMDEAMSRIDYKLNLLAPGDSIVFLLKLYTCCALEDTFGIEKRFEGVSFSTRFRDECLTFQGNDIVSITRESVYWEQFYEPFISDMTGAPASVRDTAWFAITNLDFNFNFYKLNPDRAVFNIKLKLDTGLAYLPGSFMIKSPSSLIPWSPYQVKSVTGAATDGFKDSMIVASFSLPANMKTKQDFDEFFQESEIIFQLYAYCPAKEPTARFVQETSIIPDSLCGGCEISLSQIQSDIGVHCPGCKTPGWSIQDASFQRTSFGERDDDDNLFPDDNISLQTPTDSLIFKNRGVIGDTVLGYFTANLVDGDPITGKTFAQLSGQFDFDYSYYAMTIPHRDSLDIINIKVAINDAVTGIDTINLPITTVTRVLTDTVTFFFDLSLDTLHQYGLDPASDFATINQLSMWVNYVIRYNVDSLRQFKPIGVNHKLFLTGEPKTSVDGPDAINTANNDPNLLDSTHLYWCDGFGSFFTYISFFPNHTMRSVPQYQGNVCKNFIDVFADVTFSSIFENVFPNEYRNLTEIDTVRLFIPNGYALKNLSFTNTYNTMAGNDVVTFDQGVTIDTALTTKEGSFVMIPLGSYYKKLTAPLFTTPGSPIDTLVSGDEDYNIFLRANLVPLCNDTTSYMPPNLSSTIYYNKFPGGRRDSSQISIQNRLSVIIPEINIEPTFNITQASSPTICWPFNLRNPSNLTVENLFIKAVSPSGNINVTELENFTKSTVTTLDSNGLFRIGSIGSLESFNLCGNLLCDGSEIATDSIIIYYGWNCLNYPDSSLSDLCDLDTAVYYLLGTQAGLQAVLNGPDTVAVCDTIRYHLDMNVTGVGGIDNLRSFLPVPYNDGLTLINAYIEYGSNTIPIPTSSIDSLYVWDIDSLIATVGYQGFNAGTSMDIYFDFITDCNYNLNNVGITVSGNTYSCKPLPNIYNENAPSALLGISSIDNLTLEIINSTIDPNGGVTNFDIIIKNVGADSTTQENSVSFFMPPAFSFLSSNSPPPDSIESDYFVWSSLQSIDPGDSAVLSFSLTNDIVFDCDPIFEVAVNREATLKCGATDSCLTNLTLASLQKEIPLNCPPCSVTLEVAEVCDTLPVNNYLNWSFDVTNGCRISDSVVFGIHYAPNTNGAFEAIATTSDTFFVHQNIPTFAGCYYISVTDTNGISGKKSEPACNSACGALVLPSNFITPNNDGINDVFSPVAVHHDITSFALSIFNRWGKPVFSSTDKTNAIWDPRNVADGIYYYTLKVGYNNAEDETFRGWIMVAR